MDGFAATGSRTHTEVRARIDRQWGEVLKKLSLPCSKEATLERKISHALRSLKEDQLARDARQRLAAAVVEVVGHEWRKQVSELIEGAELKSPTQEEEKGNLSSSFASQNHYGAITHEFPKAQTTKSPAIHKVSCCGFTVVTILLLLVLGAIVAMAALTLTNTSQSGEHWVQEGDTVMLSRTKSLWYREFVIEETLQEGDSDHSIDAWVLPCGSLKERSKQLGFRSRSLYLYYETFLLGEQPGETPIYLLAGSQITYKFLISANLTLSTKPEFYIFDNKKAFQSFIYGKMEGVKSAIYHRQLAVGTPQNPALTELSYTVKHNGYYYMTGYSEPGISYQFNATEHVLYLNTSDYRGKYTTCQFSFGETCSFVTDNSLLGSNEEYCLITHINQPYSEDPPSTHIEVETNKRYEILLLPGVVAIVGLIALTVSGVALFVVVIRKRRVQGYTRIQ